MTSRPVRFAKAVLAVWLSCSQAVGAVVAGNWQPHSLQPHALVTRQTATSFQLATTGSLTPFGLASACEQVLYQSISCDPYVKNLGLKVYHGSPGDTAFTNTICAASCSTALTNARRRISGSCASTPNLYPGYPVLAIIDAVVSGWNETCLKDTDGGYCNAKIEAFPVVTKLEDMPQTQLCSFCFGEKLRLMQRSPFSAYDELHAQTLQYINQSKFPPLPPSTLEVHRADPDLRLECAKTSPTTPLPPAINPNGTTPDSCGSGSKYTTKAGDTCNSISLAHSVSSSTLYHINSNLLNCSSPAVGSQLCLPVTCPVTHTVQTNETCVAIASKYNTTSSWQDITTWNTGLDDRCSNVWSPPSSSRYWGNVICVSAPGGLPPPGVGNGTTPGNGDVGGPGGSGDGYADTIVSPPAGGIVAPGTTAFCGFYVRVESGATCTGLISSAAVPMSLFLSANKSLKSATTCSQDLVVGNSYCLHPVRGFEAMATTTASGVGTTATATATRTA